MLSYSFPAVVQLRRVGQARGAEASRGGQARGKAVGKHRGRQSRGGSKHGKGGGASKGREYYVKLFAFHFIDVIHVANISSV